MSASLVVTGSGIKSISHLTTEAITYIRSADLVLYAVNEPLIADWICRANANSHTLDEFESQNIQRVDKYAAMTQHIINEVKRSQHVCVVFYGHPTIYAKSAMDAVNALKADGYDTLVLPGISADACLFADLNIDPSSHGLIAYEATDMLLRQKHIDKHCHIVLWQLGMIGAFGSIDQHDNSKGALLLKHYLLRFYAENHQMIAYEAALYPHGKPRIELFQLSNFDSVKLTPLTTLYITPAGQAITDTEMLIALRN